jgi:hypothetical protein
VIGFLTDKECVYYAVRTESLNVIQVNLSFKGLILSSSGGMAINNFVDSFQRFRSTICLVLEMELHYSFLRELGTCLQDCKFSKTVKL